MPGRKKDYLAKDFNAFRSDLLSYAKNYFADQIQDFSEASMGGLLLDMAAYVGDSMAYYLDYQFNELNPALATETDNIVNHAKNAGVKIFGAAPSVVDVTFYIKAKALQSAKGNWGPDPSVLPTILAEKTTLSSGAGIIFTLDEDLNFAELNSDGVLDCSFVVSSTNSGTGMPEQYIVTKSARCVSGKISNESFTCGASPQPFKTISLNKQDVSEILKVIDSSGREYYEVETLSQDVVYKRIQNLDKDKKLVESSLEIIAAPRRFIRKTDFRTRLTTIQFGSGDDSALDDDILPDPSELALPLYGKKVFNRFTIDPNSLLKTKTLGITPTSTVISVIYRSGGGITNNVPQNSIRNIITVEYEFPQDPSREDRNSVIGSTSVKNLKAAAGGANPLTLNQLRSQIASARNQQSRIVTEQDLLARIFTMPSNFGRVHKAGIRKDERNPLSTQLFILCQKADGSLGPAPDMLKKNLSIYLNEFRLISDAVDVLDGTVINYGIKFNIVCAPGVNKAGVVASAVSAIANVSKSQYFQIDQPVLESDVINAIINTTGVISLSELDFFNISGNYKGNTYSDYVHDMNKNKFKGLYVGPIGTIFELKDPGTDISGTAE